MAESFTILLCFLFLIFHRTAIIVMKAIACDKCSLSSNSLKIVSRVSLTVVVPAPEEPVTAIIGCLCDIHIFQILIQYLIKITVMIMMLANTTINFIRLRVLLWFMKSITTSNTIFFKQINAFGC